MMNDQTSNPDYEDWATVQNLRGLKLIAFELDIPLTAVHPMTADHSGYFIDLDEALDYA